MCYQSVVPRSWSVLIWIWFCLLMYCVQICFLAATEQVLKFFIDLNLNCSYDHYWIVCGSISRSWVSSVAVNDSQQWLVISKTRIYDNISSKSQFWIYYTFNRFAVGGIVSWQYFIYLPSLSRLENCFI